ncbi:hypothetical protein AAFX24_22090 [Vibrio mediterranei]|uniref:hypothetical protein n=1 Tax=Vibrio mediterranei TaxID=689 RepID=UPI0038CE305D
MSDWIAFGALVISAATWFMTWRFYKKQADILDRTDRLTKLHLRQAEEKILSTYKADLSARFISLGQSKYRLRVFNKGDADARNVRLSFPNGNDRVIIDEGHQIPCIESGANKDFLSSGAVSGQKYIDITIVWDDDSGAGRQKELKQLDIFG